jgi:SAM-dependent methyltransferase
MDAESRIAQNVSSTAVKHLPYEIDPSRNRYHYYESYWKKVGFDLLAKHLELPGKSLLDYGCGRGEALDLFSAAGMQVVGTDTDPECVRIAAAHCKAVLLDPAAPVAQFGSRSFDCVSCFHVLEHVPSPITTLRQLAQIARSHVVVAVPNLRVLNWIAAREIKLAYVNEGHLQGWDHWHFRNLAERHCGLDLIAWANDTTILPLVSELSNRILGQRFTISLETGLFRRIFPFHCLSIIGLFRVK